MSYTQRLDRRLMFTCQAVLLLAVAAMANAYGESHKGNSASGPISSSTDGPFDDFSADIIDRTKWANTEFTRRVESGKLVSAVTRFGSNGGNTMRFAAAREIAGFKADVTVTQVENMDARPRAHLIGAFYNDGTPGSGLAGDVLGGVTITHDGTKLVSTYFVVICNTNSCNVPGEYKVINWGRFGPGTLKLNEMHTLSIDFDGQKFNFGFDAVTVVVDPTRHTPVVDPPRSAFKGIGTRIGEIDGPDEGGFIAATFDNVVVTSTP